MENSKRNIFVKAISLKGVSIIALKGALKEKEAPYGYVFQDISEYTSGLNAPICDLVTYNQWKPIISTPWELPEDCEIGTVIPVLNGHLYIKLEENWLLLTSER